MRRLLKSGTVTMIIMVVLLGPSNLLATEKKGEKSQPADTINLSKVEYTVKLDLPEADNFKHGFRHEDSVRWVDIYYPKGQSSYNWQEMVWVECFKHKTMGVDLPGTAREKYLDARKGCPGATWDIIKKGVPDEEFPYIIFQIKCPGYTSKDPADVQIWKIMATRNSLFVVEWSYRGSDIPVEKKDKILAALQATRVVTVKKR